MTVLANIIWIIKHLFDMILKCILLLPICSLNLVLSQLQCLRLRLNFGDVLLIEEIVLVLSYNDSVLSVCVPFDILCYDVCIFRELRLTQLRTEWNRIWLISHLYLVVGQHVLLVLCFPALILTRVVINIIEIPLHRLVELACLLLG